jgi:uncharacterized protein (DUF3820 family)
MFGRMILTVDEVIRYRMPFGKYKGELIVEVFEKDRNYFDFMLDKVKGKTQEAMQLIIKDHEWRKRMGYSPRRTK